MNTPLPCALTMTTLDLKTRQKFLPFARDSESCTVDWASCKKNDIRASICPTLQTARARVCVCVCVCVSKWKRECQTNGKHHKRKSQAQWKEKYRTGRGPFRQSSHCHPDKRKRERLSTKSTHVTVYLFRDLNRDRSRLLWMTVGPKGQYSAKRRTRKRQSSKTFKRWSNLHRRRPLAVLRTSGVIVHLAPGASRRALGYVRSNFWHTHTLGTRTAETKRKKKSKLKERRKKK